MESQKFITCISVLSMVLEERAGWVRFINLFNLFPDRHVSSEKSMGIGRVESES